MPIKKHPLIQRSTSGNYKGIIFIRGIPDEVKNQFKAYCARRGISMTTWVTKQMREALRADGIRK